MSFLVFHLTSGLFPLIKSIIGLGITGLKCFSRGKRSGRDVGVMDVSRGAVLGYRRLGGFKLKTELSYIPPEYSGPTSKLVITEYTPPARSTEYSELRREIMPRK